jgi:hypothetical protein
VAKIIIDAGERTRITVETIEPTKLTEDLVNLSEVYGNVGKLDLADFDEPAEEERECDVVGCRRSATCEVELIEADSRTIGRYCERHGQFD